ncbi:hypothetical protein KJ855_00665 [Patescibacteria group bacterium]|nr:hypothetical protein [Patescibacteria group bacterium]
MEKKVCKRCSVGFVVEDEDLEFYQKVSPEFGGKKYLIPSPTLCCDCRFRRRLSMRNERRLYQRKCDKGGEMIVTIYDQDSPFKVYSQKEWWGDDWDARDFGQEFDFGRPFFEQFNGLREKVPRISLVNVNHVNSDFINHAVGNKDCYMSFDIGKNEKVLFSRTTHDSVNVVDSIYCKDHCENIYECVGCSSLSNSRFCVDGANSSNCYYSYDLKGCRDCLFCSNLRKKQYCINNEQLSREKYENRIKEYDFGSYEQSKKYYETFLRVFKNAIRPYADLLKCENCTGDYLLNCKNSKVCFDCEKLEDCKYMYGSPGGKECYDDCFTGYETSQYNYETIGCETLYHGLFCFSCWTSNKNIIYCDFCHGCSNCFGCTGLRKAEYCILNKQFTKEEYEELVPRIIEHMQSTGEWGEFFPTGISPFAYNETIANDYFPMSQEEAAKIGGRWKEIVDNLVKTSGFEVPDNIKDVNEDIVNQVLECEVTKRPYKIQPQELVFYIKNSVPIPRRHPDQRYKDRWQLINPWKLFHRQCDCQGGCNTHTLRCPNEFETTYAPDREERVYCENCYQKSVV